MPLFLVAVPDRKLACKIYIFFILSLNSYITTCTDDFYDPQHVFLTFFNVYLKKKNTWTKDAHFVQTQQKINWISVF